MCSGMENRMRNIAIIPARSGSKGYKDKNIANVGGNPLMYYSIAAARESGCCDEVMVSTDSKEYAEVAEECGANVPFLRSEENSSDKAGSWDAVREVLNEYRKRGEEFDYVILLQPTSPLRSAQDIKEAFEMIDENTHSVVSVTPVAHPVQWCFTLDETKSMKEYALSPYCNMRRQDLEVHYQENGAIYIVDAKKIMDSNYNLYLDECKAYIMPNERSADIDTKTDAVICEQMMQIAGGER